MPEFNIEDLLSFIGIETDENTTQEQLHDTFREKYILKEKAHNDEKIRNTASGRRLGELEKDLRKQVKEFGVEFGQEFSEAKLEDMIGHALKEIKSGHETKVKEVQNSFDPSEKDQAIKDWEEKYGKLETKYGETKSLLDLRVNEFDEYKSKKEEEISSFKLNTFYNSSMNSANYKNGISDLEKKGFDTHMRDKYTYQFDESGNLWPYSKETNSRIPHPKDMNKFMSLDEVRDMELKETGLSPVNDKAEQKVAIGSSVQKTDDPKPQGNNTERRVHPRAMA